MSLRPIELARRAPISDELYRHLRDAIVRGEVEPGGRITEEELAALASVSRTPVREALRRLEVDGLLRASPRGLVVNEFSPEELADVCAVRDALEALAARLAASQRRDDDVALLDRLVREYEEAMGGDLARIVELNHAFHDALWDAAHNPFLRRQLEGAWRLIERLDATIVDTEERQRETLREHRALVEALRERDADGAERLAREHFGRASTARLMQARRYRSSP
jgi:DNA-binding GntR family transcriptional regulator